jgi:phenylpyruvate tautomerase PptA (4-oxalocrotonate tautomerase family)
MPYLQLDLNGSCSADQKKRLAAKLCETYASLMQADIRRITVAIRELGEGGIWRTIDGELKAVSMLMCDIRSGRSADQRAELAKALIADCASVLGLREECVNVEFTQHSGDEMYHPGLGGFSPEWSPEEGSR